MEGTSPFQEGVAAVFVNNGSRYDLLKKSMGSFFTFNTYPLKKIIVVENGPMNN